MEAESRKFTARETPWWGKNQRTRSGLNWKDSDAAIIEAFEVQGSFLLATSQMGESGPLIMLPYAEIIASHLFFLSLVPQRYKVFFSVRNVTCKWLNSEHKISKCIDGFLWLALNIEHWARV